MEFTFAMHLYSKQFIFTNLKKHTMQIRKNTKANLESKRSIFLQVGFIVSLALVLLSFEWTTVGTEKFDWEIDRGTIIDEDLYEVTIIKEKQEVKKMKIVTPIFVNDEDDLPDDDVIIDVEVSDNTENSLFNQQEFFIEEIEKEDNEIYVNVQKRSQFPGGEAALFAFLKANINYPLIARDIGITGFVYVSFIVWKDGTIRRTNVIRGIGSGCDEEVIRVMNIMPDWEPGIIDGRKVNTIFHLPVSFKLN